MPATSASTHADHEKPPHASLERWESPTTAQICEGETGDGAMPLAGTEAPGSQAEEHYWGLGQEGPGLCASLLLTPMGSCTRPLCLHKEGQCTVRTEEGPDMVSQPPGAGSMYSPAQRGHLLRPPHPFPRTPLVLLTWPHPPPAWLHPLFTTRPFCVYPEQQACQRVS